MCEDGLWPSFFISYFLLKIRVLLFFFEEAGQEGAPEQCVSRKE